MKIPLPLSQFPEERVLIIVAGDKMARFFVAHRGMMKEAGSFRLPQESYSDREGFFEASGRAGTIRSGAVYEDHEPYEDKKFTKGLAKEVRSIIRGENIGGAYLLSPDYMKNLIFDAFPRGVQKKIRLQIVGNHTKKHPLDILKKISREEKKIVGAKAPRKEEARKILKKAKKAKRVIG